MPATLDKLYPLVSAWVDERRALGDQPEDVLALLGLAVGGPAADERVTWTQVALLAAEVRSLFRPRTRTPPVEPIGLRVGQIVASGRRVLVLSGADASHSSGFPCLPEPAKPAKAAGKATRSGEAAKGGGGAPPNLIAEVAREHGLADPSDLFGMHEFIADPSPLYDFVRRCNTVGPSFCRNGRYGLWCSRRGNP